MDGNLSQDRAVMDDTLNVASTPTGKYYKEALTLCEEIVTLAQMVFNSMK